MPTSHVERIVDAILGKSVRHPRRRPGGATGQSGRGGDLGRDSDTGDGLTALKFWRLFPGLDFL